MPKMTLGITGVREILGRDYGIEERYGDPLSCLKPLFDRHHWFSGVSRVLSGQGFVYN